MHARSDKCIPSFVISSLVFLAAVSRLSAASYEWLPTAELPGFDGPVYAMAAFNGRLYAGGGFTTAGTTVVNNIACWDPLAQTWTALGAGMGGDNPNVYALTVFNGKLIAGGEFTTAGGTLVNRIASWDPDTQGWSAFSSGMTGSFFAPDAAAVYAMTVRNGKLFVGGYFFNAGATEVDRVTYWDPDTMSWFRLQDEQWAGAGSGDHVYALAAVDDGLLYAGGDFLMPYGESHSYGIVTWDPVLLDWSTFGAGLGGAGTSQINAMLFLNGVLYAGGRFTSVGEVSASNVASFDPATQTWSALAAGIGAGMSEQVNALATMDGKLYAGGSFAVAGGTEAFRVACWDPATQSWSNLGAGVNDTVRAMAVLDGALYVGGDFTYAGGGPAGRWACWQAVEAGGDETGDDGTGGSDADGDGVADDADNCAAVSNADQADRDGDGVGDACDGCPDDPNSVQPGPCGCGSGMAATIVFFGLMLMHRRRV